MATPRVVRTFTIVALTSVTGILAACGGATEALPSTGTAPVGSSEARAALAAALRPVGTACAFSAQCASRSCSADVPHGACGVCLDVRPLGARCDGALTGCSETAVCRDGTCRTLKKTLGESCHLGGKGDSSDCDADFFCLASATDRYEGSCVAKSRPGGACKPWLQRCLGAATCERGVCVAPRFGALGDPCDEGACADGLACLGEAGGHTCQRPHLLSVGTACGGSSGYDCEPGARCELTGAPQEGGSYAMACQPGRLEGQECASNHCAIGLFCDDTTDTRVCQRRRRVAEPCKGNNECADGLECRAGACTAACR